MFTLFLTWHVDVLSRCNTNMNDPANIMGTLVSSSPRNPADVPRGITLQNNIPINANFPAAECTLRLLKLASFGPTNIMPFVSGVSLIQCVALTFITFSS